MTLEKVTGRKKGANLGELTAIFPTSRLGEYLSIPPCGHNGATLDSSRSCSTGRSLNRSAPLVPDHSPRGRVVRRLWRAPRQDGAAVIEPAWNTLPDLVSQQTLRLSQVQNDWLGQSWQMWRQQCRTACLSAAHAYTSSLIDGVPLPSLEGPLIAGGHQPELFHPGVWAKNIAIGRLAARTGGTALHLIVDNDASSQSAVMIPTGDRAAPGLTPLPFDQPRPLQPWENVSVQDRALFASFAERLTEQLRPWGIEPLAHRAWPAAVKQWQHSPSLVGALTAARAQIERQWGLQNLELPLSQLCTLPPFLTFAGAILRRLPEFVTHYNAVVHEYRALNRVRSRSHPVPDLARDGDWWEAPFWVWKPGDLRRGRLWVRRAGNQLQLRDHREIFLELPANDSGDESAQRLASLERQGIHLRTRALTTTLFARCGVADLFVHGLGGAKYDEMTDALIGRLFDIDPPVYLTVTATRYLPLGGPWNATPQSMAHIQHQLRDLEQNPQRHFSENSPSDNPEVAQRIAERQLLLTQLQEGSTRRQRGQRRMWYLRLQEINRELTGQLHVTRSELLHQQSVLQSQLAANQVLARREFSWLLYPEESLTSLYGSLFE